METLVLTTDSPAATRRLGTKLARLLRPGDVLLLSGELGSGKTRLAQGVAQGLGVEEWVNSPSFVLLTEYQGRNLKVYHGDLYRLEDPAEVAELHLGEYASDGVLLVEWPERAWEELPEEHLLVRIEITGAKDRRFIFEAHGYRFEEIIAALQHRTRAAAGGDR